MKRFLAVFLCLCLLGIGGFVGAAKAGKVFVYVSGTTLTQDGDSVNGGSGTATLTIESGNPVLTLDNYTYSGPGYDEAAIQYYGDAPLTIRLVGSSSVTHESSGNEDFSCGFYSVQQNVAVTIEGTGSLKLYGGNNRYSYGMKVNGPLTISGGQVEAVGANLDLTDKSGYSHGIWCKSMKIQGGTVIAAGGKVTVTETGFRAYSYGIYAENNIEITGGAVEASAGEATDTYSNPGSDGITSFNGKLNIGADIEYVRAKGHRKAIGCYFKNAVKGSGFDNYEGFGQMYIMVVSGNDQQKNYKHIYFRQFDIKYVITFKVVNGEWNNGGSADRTVTLSKYQFEDLSLCIKDSDVPGVGEKPADGYKAGGWDVKPETMMNISQDKTYTYTYAPAPISAKVTFKVVNGTWNDGTAGDKTVTLNGQGGDILKLKAGDIPAVGSKPDQYYKAGGWDVTPDTETEIKGEKTFTYTYEKTPVTLSVTDVQGAEHEKESGEDTVITVKGSPDDRDTYKNFQKASVDGMELKLGKDADKAEGSLILTIRSAYLDTLSEGNHKVTLAFANGTVETTLKVRAAAPTPTEKPTDTPAPTATPTATPAPTATPKPVPKTGDTAPLILWGGLVILGIIGISAVMTTYGKKRKK